MCGTNALDSSVTFLNATDINVFRNKLTLVTALKLSPVSRGYEVDG